MFYAEIKNSLVYDIIYIYEEYIREKKKTERGNRERDKRFRLRAKASEERQKARLDKAQKRLQNISSSILDPDGSSYTY